MVDTQKRDKPYPQPYIYWKGFTCACIPKVYQLYFNKRELLKTRKIKNKKGIISLRGTERSVSFGVSS